MTRVRKELLAIFFMCAMCFALSSKPSALAQTSNAAIDAVIKDLNSNLESLKGTEDIKSYKILFDAYLTMSPPPKPVGPAFNLNTIYPKMDDWSAVSGWAESNLKMAQAVLACKDKVIIGLPYGTAGLPPAYIKADLVADIGVGGSLRNNQFRYLKALDTIAAYCTAEIYRLMEAGKIQEGLNLSVAEAFVVRQFCDREFLVEKTHAIDLLSDVLSDMRDVFYTYRDKISTAQFAKIAIFEIPFLRPDRSRLFMPEADRILSEALIREVFNASTDQPDPDKFASTFAEIQSLDAPLTRLGAARRWRSIVGVHGSLTASRDRLQLIYDDWWRRWRVQEYDDILNYRTQFERTNPIRYAAVIYSMQNIGSLFEIRNQLRVEVNATALAAGLCAYQRDLGAYPDDAEKTYTRNVRKRSNSDPYDKELKPFQYKLVTERKAISTDNGRIWIEPADKECLLWSVGQDHQDNQADQHTDDGSSGDIVLWPPIKSLLRKNKLVQ